MNECMFIGNLGADVEVKAFQNGGRIANIRLAVSEKWKDRATGERREHTEWIPIVIQAEGLVGVAEKYLRKGSKVLVRGKWKTRKWADKDGNDRYTTEVVVAGVGGSLTMLDGPSGNRDSGSSGGDWGAPAAGGSEWGGGGQRASGGSGGWGNDLDSDIPF